MLCESSTTKANATEAPALRFRDKREHCTNGVAPITAKHAISSARIASSQRSSSVARSRATERAAGTKRSGRKIALARATAAQQVRGDRNRHEQAHAERSGNQKTHVSPPTESSTFRTAFTGSSALLSSTSEPPRLSKRSDQR